MFSFLDLADILTFLELKVFGLSLLSYLCSNVFTIGSKRDHYQEGKKKSAPPPSASLPPLLPGFEMGLLKKKKRIYA